MILCIYAYYEKNRQYKDNFQFFLDYAINKNVQYVFVINGECTIDLTYLKSKKNVEFMYRENTGFDFGAYAYCINEKNIENFDHFIFCNSSVRGPLDSSKTEFWQDSFLTMINENTKLVGVSINILTHYDKKLDNIEFPYSHVQSMIFAMDYECLQYLKQSIFGLDTLDLIDKEEVILKREILMSQLVLQNGWNINCCLNKYKDLDYRSLKKDINPTSHYGDPSYKNKYFGSTYTIDDGALFMKTDPMRQLFPAKKVQNISYIL